MTFQLHHSEFPYLWGKFCFLFYQCANLSFGGWNESTRFVNPRQSILWRWKYLCTATKNPTSIFHFQERNCVASVPIYTYMYLWAIYILPRSVHIFSCSRPILGINKSLKDTWMWKLGLWPSNSFSGNICYEFSASYLYSGGQKVKCELTVEPALQMKGRWESNINIWFPFMYSQKWNVISKTEL